MKQRGFLHGLGEDRDRVRGQSPGQRFAIRVAGSDNDTQIAITPTNLLKQGRGVHA